MSKRIFSPGPLVVGLFLGMLAQGAGATLVTTTFNLSGAAGSATYTDQGATFYGWQYNSGTNTIDATNLTYKSTSSDETGLGVSCTTGPKCSQNETNATPAQAITVDISKFLPGLVSLTLDVGSVDSDNDNTPETAYIYKSDSNLTSNPASYMSFASLGSYTGSNANNTHTFTFNASDNLQAFIGFSPISAANFGTGDTANILLASLSITREVPEPSALAMLGFGLIGIGFLARRHQSPKK